MNVGMSASGHGHCGKILLLAVSLNTCAAAAGEEKRKWGTQNRERHTEDKDESYAGSRASVSRVDVARELSMQSPEWH